MDSFQHRNVANSLAPRANLMALSHQVGDCRWQFKLCRKLENSPLPPAACITAFYVTPRANELDGFKPSSFEPNAHPGL
ncbi:MAG: hypothetical protein DME32_18480 [Verrucomicrobia bacterium]|nr:MAG: hypothetical protein DME32_18480 [Verrucomicrobiota bacterium]